MKAKKLVKELKEKKEPIYLDKVELGDGEIYLGNLSDADKYQILARRLNEFSMIMQNHTLLLANMTVCLQEIAKKQGIEINKIIDQKN